MAAALLLEQQRGLDIVGLDAADVVGFLQRTRGSKVSAQRTDLSVGHKVMEVIKKKSTTALLFYLIVELIQSKLLRWCDERNN